MNATLVGAGVLALLVLVALVVREYNPSGLETPAPERSQGEEAVERGGFPDLPEGAVAHGDWEVGVHGVEYGVPAAELERADEPQGQWVVIDLTVRNGGTGSAAFPVVDQLLVGADGSEHRHVTGLSEQVGAALGPQESDRGVLVYDVPAGFTADHFLVNGEGPEGSGARLELD